MQNKCCVPCQSKHNRQVHEGVAWLYLMTDPQMMQLDTVQMLFSVKQLIADAISLFALCSSAAENVCRYLLQNWTENRTKYSGFYTPLTHATGKTQMHTRSGGLHTFPVASEREDKPKSGCSPAAHLLVL